MELEGKTADGWPVDFEEEPLRKTVGASQAAAPVFHHMRGKIKIREGPLSRKSGKKPALYRPLKGSKGKPVGQERVDRNPVVWNASHQHETRDVTADPNPAM